MEKKKSDCRILRVWPVVTVILRISLHLSKRMHAASLLLDVAWEWHSETPSPCWALLCCHGHVSPWSSVQSVSSPPFPLPLLYLYCQETSFHLGLLCFVRWVLHYIMCLFLCVLWGCLEHKAHCKLILEQKGSEKINLKKKKSENKTENKQNKSKNVGCVIRRSQYLYHWLPNVVTQASRVWCCSIKLLFYILYK